MLLNRDPWWPYDGPPHLEFVVDNATVGALANVEVQVSNPLYSQIVSSIWEGLRRTFTNGFDPKGASRTRSIGDLGNSTVRQIQFAIG